MDYAGELMALALTLGAFVFLIIICYWLVALIEAWRRLK